MQKVRYLAVFVLIACALHAQDEGGKRKGPGPEDISTDDLISTSGPSFRIPVAELHGGVRVIAYGDQRFTDPTNTQVTNPIARRWLVEKIAAEHPSAVLMSGDVPYSGDHPDDYAVYRKETEIWRKEKLHVYPALGNHEFHGDPHEALEHWWTAFPEMRNRRWYSVQIGGEVETIALDSDTSLAEGSNQRRWLQDQLAHLPGSIRFVLISLHHPPVADVQTHINVSHNPRPNEIGLRDFLEAAAPKMKAKIVVIGGHIHNYERHLRGGVVYLVSGGGGAKPVPVERTPEDLYQNNDFPNFHFVEFTLTTKGLEGKMYRLADAAAAQPAWEVRDTFEVNDK